MKRKITALILFIVMVFSGTNICSAESPNDRILSLLNKSKDYTGFEMNGKVSLLGISTDLKMLQQGWKIKVEYKILWTTYYVLNDGEYSYSWNSSSSKGKQMKLGDSVTDFLKMDFNTLRDLDVEYKGNETFNEMECDRYGVKIDDIVWECLISTDYGVLLNADKGLMKIKIEQVKEAVIDECEFCSPEGITFVLENA